MPHRQANWTDRFTKWIMAHRRLANALMFSIALTTTAASAAIVEYAEREQAYQRQRVVLLELGSSIQQRANANIAFLRSGAAMMTTTPDVPLEQFRRYVADLKLDSNFRGALGLGWSVVADRRSAGALQGRMRDAYDDPSLRLWSADPDKAGRSLHAIFYLEPQTPLNRKALGFDMSSETVRRAAMDTAAITGQPSATSLIALVQDDGPTADQSLNGKTGFIIYIPVYAQNSRYGAFSAQPGALRGYIYSPFRVTDFLSEPLRGMENDRFRIIIFDVDPRGKERRVVFTNQPEMTTPINGATSEVTIADRKWRIVLEDRHEGVLTKLALFTLAIGLLITLMLLAILALVMRNAEENERALALQEEQAAIRASLSRELNHRVKNTLANVISIASLARKHATDIDSYVDALTGRIRALSATQDLLVKSEWGDTPVEALVRAELAPYFGRDSSVIDIAGPDLLLAPNDALGLGLAVHELATNAAKYGALSVAEGRVTIRWELVSADRMEFRWEESGGPPVAMPEKRGFGSNLIERAIARDFGSKAKIIFDPAGVRCVMTVPLRKRQQFQLKQ